MTQFSVTQNGTPLDPRLYSWDGDTKTFSTNQDNLVIDFSSFDGVTFKTGHYCTFNTGPNCTFKTGHSCTFDTGYNCIFMTCSKCTFKTGDNCVLIRYDVKGITEIPPNTEIKLNKFEVLKNQYIWVSYKNLSF